MAKLEFDDAVAWYEDERAGLGLELKNAVDQALALAAEQPTLFRAVRGQVRRVVLKRFPYGLYFLEEPARVVVLAVFHGSRDPKYLRGR